MGRLAPGSEARASDFPLRPIGYVSSPLRARADAPRQGDEGAPDADIVVLEPFAGALDGLGAGMDIVVITWLHEADREVRRTRPRDDPRAEERGVFATRSPDRPNPLGLHPVRLLAVEGARLRVRGLEAIDATPVVDLKPLLTPR